jgi:hypothetical protein
MLLMPIDTHTLRVDKSKIVDYLLSHSNGQGKAAFFLRFGFQTDAWTVLADDLKRQARNNPVAIQIDSPYGTRYSVDGELQTPSGRRPKVRTVWILEPNSTELPFHHRSPYIKGNMITEHASAVLVEDIPGAGLEAGDVGVVIHIHDQGTAYEVEFMALDGHTLTIQTLEARQIRAARSIDVPHVRARIAA